MGGSKIFSSDVALLAARIKDFEPLGFTQEKLREESRHYADILRRRPPADYSE